VRLKKLAGNLVMMGQSGQYNYGRCIARGDSAAAQLTLAEFVKSALNVIFLINKKYVPYYKWSFRALAELERLSELGVELEYLISSANGESEVLRKKDIIERVCNDIANALVSEGLIDTALCNAEKCAYQVNDRISNGEIRNLHILYAI
jgi:hypothetical protein